MFDFWAKQAAAERKLANRVVHRAWEERDAWRDRALSAEAKVAGMAEAIEAALAKGTFAHNPQVEKALKALLAKLQPDTGAD